MGYNIVLTDHALEDLEQLDDVIAKRVVKKLQWFARQSNPLQFAKPLRQSAAGDYRFRIGEYRAIAIIRLKQRIEITAIGHRNEIYR
jgi:mRNA interferase RelE/StbE